MRMPFSVKWNAEGQTVLCSGSGVVTGQEILRDTEACLARHERLRTLLRATIVLAGITGLEITVEEVRVIASLDARLAALNPRVTVAIVAPQDVVFGFARMWETLVEATGWKTRVFRTEPEAEAWLKSSPTT